MTRTNNSRPEFVFKKFVTRIIYSNYLLKVSKFLESCLVIYVYKFSSLWNECMFPIVVFVREVIHRDFSVRLRRSSEVYAKKLKQIRFRTNRANEAIRRSRSHCFWFCLFLIFKRVFIVEQFCTVTIEWVNVYGLTPNIADHFKFA